MYDLFMAMGQNGCKRLTKIDLRCSKELSENIAPLLKFCHNIKFFGFLKTNKPRDADWYIKLIHNTDIEHFAVKTTNPEHFTDSDVLNLMLIQPSINKLEFPSSNISDLSLLQIANEQSTLVMLNVSNCLGITDYGLREILRQCLMLKHLNVRNTPTMSDCIRDVFSHLELRYLNALETNLTEQNAQAIKRFFDQQYRTYEFLWSRSVVGAKNHYRLLSVNERNRTPYSDRDRPTEQEMHDAVHIDQHIWDDSKATSDMLSRDPRQVEMAANKYLKELKIVGKQKASDSIVINNWEETAFDVKSMRRFDEWDEISELRRRMMMLEEDESVNLVSKEDRNKVGELEARLKKLEDQMKHRPIYKAQASINELEPLYKDLQETMRRQV